MTTLTQEAAAAKLGADEAQALTAYLRSTPGKAEAHKPAGLALSRLRLEESLAAVHAGDRAAATRLGLSAYLDGFEPIEPMVGARNKSLLLAVENAMLAYRSAVAKGTVADAEAAGDKLQQLFTHVEAELGDAKAEPMTTFIGALTILLREGVEALLIVIGIIAFLRKAKRNDVLPYVHGGWISALVAGGLTWVAATYLGHHQRRQPGSERRTRFRVRGPGPAQRGLVDAPEEQRRTLAGIPARETHGGHDAGAPPGACSPWPSSPSTAKSLKPCCSIPPWRRTAMAAPCWAASWWPSCCWS